jgi:hypothetical protein
MTTAHGATIAAIVVIVVIAVIVVFVAANPVVCLHAAPHG